MTAIIGKIWKIHDKNKRFWSEMKLRMISFIFPVYSNVLLFMPSIVCHPKIITCA